MCEITAVEFGRLFMEYRNRFVRIAESYIHDRAAAEDIVADCFTKFWDIRSQINIQTSAQAYILTSIKNKCLNYLRDTANRQKLYSERAKRLDMDLLESSNADSLLNTEVEQLMSTFMETLPEDTRCIFSASRLEGLTYAEISLKYGYSPRKVRREICKALETMRDILATYI